jgi:GrpB-like predicted nucleotidyltransferase (UPF0157 family)
MERYGGGPIVIVAYDPAWKALFEEERTKLAALLGALVVAIEHVGSTAVPGLAAKPIIDLMVGVRSLTEAKCQCVESLQAAGYAYLPEYQSWLPGELFFRKGVSGRWTHHAHVMEPSNPGWRRRLLFRDYLRGHPDSAEAYAKLKRDLAAAFKDDIAAYRNAKDEFVAETMAKAREERGA